MARYTTTARTDWSTDRTFAYLADFRSVSDWDPSIESSELVAGEPLKEGARYDVTFEILGRTTTFHYRVIEVVPHERIVLRAEESSMTSVDTMTFRSTEDGGTEVGYDADITLSGALRLLDPLFSLAFQRVGNKARDGLRERLAGEPPAGS